MPGLAEAGLRWLERLDRLGFVFLDVDQARVVTPGDAIAAGATYLVVGRPILDAPNPAKAAQQIADEIEAACEREAVG